MKTTFDLPDSLVKELKRRALNQGRKLKDEVTDVLRAGLAAVNRPVSASGQTKSPRVKTNPQTGLPFIGCGPKAKAMTMTAEELIVAEQASLTREDIERLGLPD
jgi:plasmid stability protein